MPEQQVEMSEQLRAELERVRQQQGLDTLEQTVEWLLRRRIRRGAQHLTGRGRALYPIEGNRQ